MPPHSRYWHTKSTDKANTQSDPVSRKRPFSTGPFFDWVLLVLLQSSRFYSVCALPRGSWFEGMREYCVWQSKIGWPALCLARSPRATRASRATNPRQSGLVALGLCSRKPPKLRSWCCTQPCCRQSYLYSRRSRCWQNGIDTARCCRRVTHAAGEWS